LNHAPGPCMNQRFLRSQGGFPRDREQQGPFFR
jgi:hypothetical protein